MMRMRLGTISKTGNSLESEVLRGVGKIVSAFAELRRKRDPERRSRLQPTPSRCV